MIHAIDNHVNNHVFSIPLGIGLFVVVSAVVALCANHARRASKKEVVSKDTIASSSSDKSSFNSFEDDHYQEKIPPRSPLRSPRQLITTISNKAMSSFVVNHKKSGDQDARAVEEGFGQGGVWQKEILMGVKCQPPEFSGVIYYDYDGRQVSEFPPRSPRSPRIAPTSDFTFPMIKNSA
nr:HTH-type transcriptional regulator SgrR like [Tanacetum cinerariifolium]